MDNKIFILLISLVLASCGGKTTFQDFARAGDTVAIPVGMQPDFSKDNITVTITPSDATGPGDDIIIPATDPSIRAVINFYPDPVSNMLVSRGIGENTSPNSLDYAYTAGVSANEYKDWFQTTVFLDLPSNLPEGVTQIVVTDGGNSHTSTMQIIPGTGSPNEFRTTLNNGLPLNSDILYSLGRASHSVVDVDATTIPHAIEIKLTHDLDVTQGGSGKATVINPLGYLMNISWSDDGTNMKIIMMQSKDGSIDNMKDYRFYVAGTVTNLAFDPADIKGYDINGNDITGTSGLSASLVPSN